jgi:hypothetical protein
MKLHTPSILLGAIFTAIVGLTSAFQTGGSSLTAQQKAVLDLLSVQYLNDCQGGTGYKTLRVTGANLQVVNGLNGTGTTNGLGNIIVGYNENGSTCDRSGSHNIVLGSFNNYNSSSFAGIIGGYNNNLLSSYSQLFGTENVINGQFNTILGGTFNGTNNSEAIVIGGEGNNATGEASVIVGGQFNIATGRDSVVGGGQNNTASGGQSSVSGGSTRSATSTFNWAAGSLFEPN